ncbi:MAG: PrgI family protein [Patescibacteria group bacterium]|nr:PrgI family protein [Patescibacteria group bacterium]
MQQFTVPQFIDVEPKIIGPITTRQFLIFLGAALIIFIFYKIFDFSTFVISSVLVFAISGTFAFLKINGRPFHYFILNLVQAVKKPGLRIWNHKAVSFENKEEKQIEYEKVITPDKYFAKEKLAELSLIIDTKGRYKGEDSADINIKDN